MVAVLATLMWVFTGIAAAHAATLRCDGCTTNQLRNVAKSAGEGSHYIIDATNVKLTKWSVEYVPDGPTWVAYPVTVPSNVQTQFLDVMDRKATAKAAGQTYSTIVINTKTGFNESYLGNFNDIIGYDIASDVGLRNSVGQTLAQNYSGFLPGLFSVLLSMSTPATAPITIRFVITLDNGVQVSFQLTAGQILSLGNLVQLA